MDSLLASEGTARGHPKFNSNRISIQEKGKLFYQIVFLIRSIHSVKFQTQNDIRSHIHTHTYSFQFLFQVSSSSSSSIGLSLSSFRRRVSVISILVRSPSFVLVRQSHSSLRHQRSLSSSSVQVFRFVFSVIVFPFRLGVLPPFLRIFSRCQYVSNLVIFLFVSLSSVGCFGSNLFFLLRRFRFFCFQCLGTIYILG